mmetsp:Transcript_27653/g.90920  ORF Transcript_27653/g.90920 Transcript_27653/m.90920 type:complete len:260 (+) Transcript_27653:493-1272(+)
MCGRLGGEQRLERPLAHPVAQPVQPRRQTRPDDLAHSLGKVRRVVSLSHVVAQRQPAAHRKVRTPRQRPRPRHGRRQRVARVHASALLLLLLGQVLEQQRHAPLERAGEVAPQTPHPLLHRLLWRRKRAPAHDASQPHRRGRPARSRLAQKVVLAALRAALARRRLGGTEGAKQADRVRRAALGELRAERARGPARAVDRRRGGVEAAEHGRELHLELRQLRRPARARRQQPQLRLHHPRRLEADEPRRRDRRLELDRL